MNSKALKNIRRKRHAYQRYLATRRDKDYLGYTKNCKKHKIMMQEGTT